MARTPFTEQVINVIHFIPKGKVFTYGAVADLAGNHRASRQVARILHTLGSKENLPWHRVINIKGEISLKKGEGYEIQKDLLQNEGVIFDEKGRVDLKTFLWKPSEEWLSKFFQD